MQKILPTNGIEAGHLRELRKQQCEPSCANLVDCLFGSRHWDSALDADQITTKHIDGIEQNI
jgi:hypothetical protein